MSCLSFLSKCSFSKRRKKIEVCSKKNLKLRKKLIKKLKIESDTYDVNQEGNNPNREK